MCRHIHDVTLPYADTFVVLDGNEGSDNTNRSTTVLQFHKPTGTYEPRPESLNSTRKRFYADIVEERFLDC